MNDLTYLQDTLVFKILSYNLKLILFKIKQKFNTQLIENISSLLKLSKSQLFHKLFQEKISKIAVVYKVNKFRIN